MDVVRPKNRAFLNSAYLARFLGALCPALLPWLLALLAASTAASERPMYFRSIDSASGLSQNTVFALKQDANGFLWMGTEQGLNRSDGYRITQFHRDQGDDGLRDSFVYALEAEPSGDLWIATARGGLARYQARSQSIVAVPLPKPEEGDAPLGIRSLLRTEDGVLWLGTIGAGIYRYDPKRGELLRVSGPATLNQADVRAVVLGPERQLWSATSQGLFVVDPLSRSARQVPLPLADSADVSLLDLQWTQAGELWAASGENGLFVSSDGGARWRQLTHEPSDSTSISTNQINTLFEEADQVLWVGTDEGLNRYNRTRRSFSATNKVADATASLTTIS